MLASISLTVVLPLDPVMAATGLDYVTVMDTDGTRYTHRNRDQIGHSFLGNTAPALRGETFTEIYPGTLGPSVRAVTPVVSWMKQTKACAPASEFACVKAMVTLRPAAQFATGAVHTQPPAAVAMAPLPVWLKAAAKSEAMEARSV